MYAMNKQKEIHIHFTVSTEHRKLFEQHLEDVDVWFFSAKFAENADEKQYLKRTDLYDRLSERMCRKHSLHLSSFNPGNDKVWVASKTKVTDADIKRFVDYCSQL